MDKKMSTPTIKRARLSKLLERGKVAILNDGDEAIPLYVKALNSMQRDEALKDAMTSVAAARLLYKPGTELYSIMISELEDESKEALVELIIETTQLPELWVQAEDNLLCRDEWQEPGVTELIERGHELIQSGLEVDNQAISDLNARYMAGWRECMEEVRGIKTHELLEKNREELYDEVIRGYVAVKNAEEYDRQYLATALSYSVRYCDGTELESGEFDHSNCHGHQAKVFSDRGQVLDLPDDIRESLVSAMRELDEAGTAIQGKA